MISIICLCTLLIVFVLIWLYMRKISTVEIKLSSDNNYYIDDGSGNYLSFDNDFSIAITKPQGTKFVITDNKYIKYGNKYVSYKRVQDQYLIFLLNNETEWKIQNDQISTVIDNQTYYLGFKKTQTSQISIVSVELSPTPTTIRVSEVESS